MWRLSKILYAQQTGYLNRLTAKQVKKLLSYYRQLFYHTSLQNKQKNSVKKKQKRSY